MIHSSRLCAVAIFAALLFSSGGCVAPATAESPSIPLSEAELTRLQELDAYWATVSTAVKQGDFESYQATCHPAGVLVSGRNRMSQPLSEALANWKYGFARTKAGENDVAVAFRFSQRFGDTTTAHETGIFRFTTLTDGQPSEQYIPFEGLLIKREGIWLLLMEYQKEAVDAVQWRNLE